MIPGAATHFAAPLYLCAKAGGWTVISHVQGADCFPWHIP